DCRPCQSEIVRQRVVSPSGIKRPLRNFSAPAADSFLQLSLPVEHHRERRRDGAVGEGAQQETLAIVAHFVATPNNESIQQRHWKQALRLTRLRWFRG